MSSTSRTRFVFGILLSAGLALPAGLAWARPVSVPLERYVLSASTDKNYFDGKFLSADDLNADQSYQLGAKRYLGPTDKDFATLFRALGVADILLEFDDGLLTESHASAPTDASAPQREDLVFLDRATPTWRGRLFIAGPNGSAGAVYDDLSGTYRGLRQVPEPSSLALLGMTALLCRLMQRRGRLRLPRM